MKCPRSLAVWMELWSVLSALPLSLILRNTCLLMKFSNVLKMQQMLYRPNFALDNSRPLPSVFWGCGWIFVVVVAWFCFVYGMWRTAALSCNGTFVSRWQCCGPHRVLRQIMEIALGFGAGTWNRLIPDIEILVFRRSYLDIQHCCTTCPLACVAC